MHSLTAKFSNFFPSEKLSLLNVLFFPFHYDEVYLLGKPMFSMLYINFVFPPQLLFSLSAINTAFRSKQERPLPGTLGIRVPHRHPPLAAAGDQAAMSSQSLYFLCTPSSSTLDTGIPLPSAPNTFQGCVAASCHELSECRPNHWYIYL